MPPTKVYEKIRKDGLTEKDSELCMSERRPKRQMMEVQKIRYRRGAKRGCCRKKSSTPLFVDVLLIVLIVCQMFVGCLLIVC